jgi:hypothetical protein
MIGNAHHIKYSAIFFEPFQNGALQCDVLATLIELHRLHRPAFNMVRGKARAGRQGWTALTKGHKSHMLHLLHTVARPREQPVF